MTFIAWCLFMVFLRQLCAHLGEETLANEAMAVMFRGILILALTPVAPVVGMVLIRALMCMGASIFLVAVLFGLYGLFLFLRRQLDLIGSIRQVIASRCSRRPRIVRMSSYLRRPASAFGKPACRLGLASHGGASLTPDDIHHALDCGVNFLNWAGDEDVFSRTIASLGSRRESVIVCVQFGRERPPTPRRNCTTSSRQ